MNVEMWIDENGVLMTRLTGVFDADEWMHQRDTIFAGPLAGVDMMARPMVTDATECFRPDFDWTTHVAKVSLYLNQKSDYTGRRAYIVGGNANARDALAYFAELEEKLRDAPNAIRAFRTLNEGYAWATENWSGPAGA